MELSMCTDMAKESCQLIISKEEGHATHYYWIILIISIILIFLITLIILILPSSAKPKLQLCWLAEIAL